MKKDKIRNNKIFNKILCIIPIIGLISFVYGFYLLGGEVNKKIGMISLLISLFGFVALIFSKIFKVGLCKKKDSKETEKNPVEAEMTTENKPIAENYQKVEYNPANKDNWIVIRNNNVYVNSTGLLRHFTEYGNADFTISDTIKITEKEPVVSVYEDDMKIAEYRLQTEHDEDFSGKYFKISVIVGKMRSPAIPRMQIDGFISDIPGKEHMDLNDIGYRMEGLILNCGGADAKQFRDNMKGMDLVAKGLKYPGYTTPTNVRLIGICSECNKSFAFHGYAFYRLQSDVAYSDDGLECCEITNQSIDKETWTCKKNNITFRYYNSFCCPHCGRPYIDYTNNRYLKEFGVSGCVHLGHTPYTDE